jgi:hypothetical protein
MERKMEENSMEEEYRQLRKKYNTLPEFEKLDDCFEIGDIDCDKSILRNIRKRISEKLSLYCDLIENMMQPEAHLSAAHEMKYLTDKERNAAFGIYKSLMRLNRYSLELGIENDDSKNAEYIKNALEVYESQKNKLKSLISFMKECWTKNDSAKEDIEYLR